MLVYRKILIILSPVLFLCIDTKGQAAQTPFSSSGLGEYYNSTLAHHQAMGGIGVGSPDYLHFNSLNPALLVFNRLTVIEAGLIVEGRTLNNGSLQESRGGVNLNYLAFGFPIKRGKYTTGIGISPYTSTNYKAQYSTAIASSTDMANVEEFKKGKINELYWSNGVAIYKNLSVGAKASYLFGSVTSKYTTSLMENDQVVRHTASVSEKQSFSGFGFSLGIAFHLDSLFNLPDHQFTAGITYRNEARLNTMLSRNLGGSTQVNVTDSTVSLETSEGTTICPQSIAGGISFSRIGRWLVGTDFTYTISSQLFGLTEGSGGAIDSWKAAIGGRWQPKVGTSSSYLRQISYQIGFSFKKTPYKVGGNEVNDFGFNIGLSLPIRRVSGITITAGVGKQGDISMNAIEEVYFKLYCGITFSDQWFIKREFD